MFYLALPINLVAFVVSLVSLRQFIDGVIFYQGVLICVLISLLNFFFLKRFKFDMKLKVVYSLMVFFMLYSFNITFPALLDRSISYYIIGVTASENGLSVVQYQEAFQRGFIINNAAIEKRLSEQIISGNINCVDGLCRLTDRGYMVYKANIFMASLLRLDTRYVKPENYKN
jgi:hypothetical protein